MQSASTKTLELLRFGNLSKRYGQRQLFNSVDLSFFEGECYLLTGSNGSGKSTLLRVMSGLLKPDGGTVSLPEKTNAIGLSWLKQQSALRDKVMYLHQNPYLFDGTVIKNLEFSLKKSWDNKHSDQVIHDALKWSGLEELSTNAAKQLSGGEKQRVALARAKLRNARVLLLDEPTANLDQLSRFKTLELLSSLKKSGVSLMIACHEYQEFLSISDGVMNLNNGLLQKT